MSQRFTLRDYQRDAIESVEAAWAEGINRPVVVMSTGAGKTVCFAGLIDRHIEQLRKDGMRVLVLAHREELLEQAEAKIKASVNGVWTSIVKASRGANTHQFADVIVASVQTLARPKRREAIDRIGMVIIDECHRAASPSYKAVMEHYGCLDGRATRTVGFTATLTRMDGGLPAIWQSVAYEKKVHWFIKNGFLVPPVAMSVQVPDLNLSNVRILAGDLDSKGIAAALEESGAYEVMAQVWSERAHERPTIAFMPNVASCHMLAEAVAAHGFRAEIVVGTTPSTERKAAYARFEARETHMLVSAMVLTEGFDAPHTSCVIMGRPTKSPGLYIQAIGRGLRLAEGKSDCLVLDLAGASLTHSLAGVNDLQSDCESAVCDCNCLLCGCSNTCKCAKRQCGCRCIEQHQKGRPDCRCAGSEDCLCGCPGDAEDLSCVCDQMPDCECRQGPEIKEAEELAREVLTTLREVDILGTELKKSGYSWLTTTGGIKFLVHGKDACLFLLPSPAGGYFQGLLEGLSPRGKVTRLDSGALPVKEALRALEAVADDSEWTYSNKRASWRRSPLTDTQASLLRSMRVPFEPNATKGWASDAISSAKISNALDGRFAKYVPAE